MLDPMEALELALDEHGVVDEDLRDAARAMFQSALDQHIAEQVDVEQLLAPFRQKPAD